MSDAHEILQQRIRDRAYVLWQEAGSPEGDEQRFWYAAQLDIDRQEASLDQEVADSFPASDPPSSSTGKPTKSRAAAPGAKSAEAARPATAPAPKARPARRAAK